MQPTRLLGGLAMLLFISGCADVTAETAESRLGRFRLSRINGNALPAFVTEGTAARIDFLSGAVHLNTDGTFVDSTELKVTPKIAGSGPVHVDIDVATGVYHVANDSVFFDSTRGEHYLMVYLSHQSLKQELAGSILLYNR